MSVIAAKVFDEPEIDLSGRLCSRQALHEYELLHPDGTVLAAVGETTGGSTGTSDPTRYLLSAADRPLLRIDRPGSAWNRLEFRAARPDGRPLGTVRQENRWFDPQLLLQLADGRTARLAGGQWCGRDWAVTVVDPLRRPDASGWNRLLGTVSRRRSPCGGPAAVTVRTDPGLDRTLRAIVLVAVIALDVVVRRQHGSRPGD